MSQAPCADKALGLELTAEEGQPREQAAVGLGLVGGRVCCLKRLFPDLRRD